MCEGQPLTVSLNRRFLKNALDFGVNRLGFDPAKQSPIVGYGDNRTFVMMPLEIAEPVIEASKITVLMSDAYSVASPKVVKVNAGEVKNGAMKSYVVTDNVAKPQIVIRQIPHADNRKIEPFASSVDVIADSENLCRTLADTLRVTQQLVRNLKQQRKQNRLMRATISSLKQLQGC